MGAGVDPTSGLGSSLGSLDPSSIFGGLGGLGGFDPLSGLGAGVGSIGSSTSSPGGDISQVASAEGDPTGALQAQQSIQAGAPTPGTPGGGIGGAQSGVPSQQPAAPAPAPQTPQPANFDQRYAGTNPAQQAAEQTPPDQQSTQAKTQYGPPMQPPADFSQRFGDASFAQRFGQNNMAPGGNMASTLPQLSQAQLAQSGIANPPPGVTNIPGQMGGEPNVDSPTAGPATPTTTGAGAAPAAGTDTGGATTAAPAGKTPSTTDTTDASSGADRQAPSGQGGGGRGGPGGGMPNINPMAIISALLRGGPMGALSELAREAQGQGMQQPSLPGGGAPGRGYSAGRTGQPGEDEGTPETPAPGQPGAPQTPEQQQQAQAAAAGQEAPGVSPLTSSGFEPGQPGQPAAPGTLQQPPAWATAAGGAPNTTATQNASLGGGNIPSTGNAQVDRWVSPQHVGLSRNAGTNTPGTPGYSSTMRDARAPYMDQLTPQDRTLLYGMMNAENEKDPIGPMESLANRAAANHMSIRHILNSGFYGPRSSFLRRGLAIQNSGRAGHYDSVINAVRRGSNVLGGATDQGSGRDPNVGWRGGRVMRSGEVYNDWGGGRGHNANRSWREQIQARVRAENAANPPRPPAPIPNAQRVGEGSPIASFGAGSMGQGNIARDWRRSSNFEDVSNPTFDQRFTGDTSPAEARIRRANYEAGLPGYQAPPSQLANALGLGDIRLDQITQLLSQLTQQGPPQ